MPLKLERITHETRSAWDNLLQLYIHELSAYTHATTDDEGRFSYERALACLSQDDIQAHYVVIKGKIAGFMVIRLREDGTREVLDYFLLHTYRGLGLGRDAALRAFSEWPGKWRVYAVEASPQARGFWRKVLRSSVSRRYKSSLHPEEGFLVFDFEFHPEEVAP